MRNPRIRMVAAGVVMVSAGAAIMGVVLPSGATSSVVTDRISGATRYDTARLIGTFKAKGSSTFAFGTPSQAVLVSGDNFPDALAAAFLAGAYKSPTFLTSQNDLRPEAIQGLQDMGIKKVTIVGGTSAIASSQDATLTANGITPTRIQGPNRDATAALVAQAPGTSVGTYNGLGATAILAADGADHYVDALAGGPLAWAGHLPVLLTGTNTLAPEAQAALSALKIKHVVILGGTAAVASTVETAVTNMGITTERLAGDTRQKTTVAIANAARRVLGFAFTHIYLAVGNNFPDALAGGPIAGLFKSPILLTSDPSTLNTDTKAFINANDGSIDEITAFGGTNAISDAVLAEASSTASCRPATTTTAGLLGLLGGRASAAAATTAAPTTTIATTTTSTTLPTCQTTTTNFSGSSTTAFSGSTTTAFSGSTTTALP